MLAVCDRAVHNKVFNSGELNFFVDPDFYGLKGASEGEIVGFFEKATIINLAGKNCIELAQKKGIIDPESVLDVGGCRHAQVVKL